MSSSIVVKCEPNEDVYLVWNRVADGPEFAGNRLALVSYLRSSTRDSEDEIKQRVNRAELQGTSIRLPDVNAWRHGAPDGHWHDSGFVYDQQGWLPRNRFLQFALAIINDEDETVYLEPFDDDIYV